MGKIIVLEGLDGAGKTTQLGLLCADLESRGTQYRRLEFPRYDDESSALVRLYLAGRFGSAPGDVNAYAASSFYAVDRYASFKSDWEADYRAGALFLAGRYTTSNAIHQGAKLCADERRRYMDWLFDYEYNLMGIPEPNHVILLDVEADISIKNIRMRNGARDIHEKDYEYLKRCRDSALDAAYRFGWSVIKCGTGGVMRPREEIFATIKEIVNREILC